jgi:hypothetical protein
LGDEIERSRNLHEGQGAEFVVADKRSGGQCFYLQRLPNVKRFIGISIWNWIALDYTSLASVFASPLNFVPNNPRSKAKEDGGGGGGGVCVCWLAGG